MCEKIAVLLTFGLFALFQPLAASAQQQPPVPPAGGYYYGPGPWHMMGGYGYGWWMLPMMLLFLLLIGGAIFLFAQSVRRGGPRSEAQWDDPTVSALRILNERFARGEIQREEFEEKKALLLFGGRR